MSKKHSVSAELFDWLEMIILSACAVLLCFTFVLRPAKVDGASMQNTLYGGEVLLLSDIGYTPKRCDIVVLQKVNSSHPDPIVKRVIATEGETIDINFDTWEVSVTDKDGNTVVLDEGAYRKLATDQIVTSDLEYPITLGEGEYFVMGDNRNHSLDSRSSAIGIVNKNEIIGKVLLRILPFDRIGIVK